MDKLFINGASLVTGDDARDARLGARFGRMDLASQLALLAVESLGVDFDAFARDRVAICLVSGTTSLSTDVAYWKDRDAVGGPSPTLFTYTLPSAPIGEIAIRHRLTGPNLCFVGTSADVLPEAAELLRRGEADGCVCVFVNVISPALASLISSPAIAKAGALFLQRVAKDSGALPSGAHELREFDRDMESLCANLRAQKLTK